MLFLRTIALPCLCLLVLRAMAQQYDIRVFGVEDGLPGSTVTAIAQDSTGFLWVRTDGGDCRFDGRNFRDVPLGSSFPIPTPLAMPPTAIPGVDDGLRTTCTLVSPRTNRYWQGTETGVQVFPQRKAPEPLFKLYWGNGLGSNDITCLFEDSSGVMWIGTRQGGLNRYISDAVLQFGREGGSYAKVMSMYRSAAGDLRIMAGENGIAYAHLPAGITGSMEGLWPGGTIRAIMGPGKKQLYAGNDEGIFHLEGFGSPHENPSIGPFIYQEAPVFAALTDARGSSWAATGKGLITIAPTSEWLHVGQDTLAACALAFHGDSILIGTHQGLYAAPLDNSAANWTPIFHAGKEDITCLAVDRADNVWIGTADAGVVRYRNGTTQRWTKESGLASDRIRQLLLDAYQNLWVGTDRGFHLFELDELQEQVIDITSYGTAESFPGIEAMPNACMLDADSSLWFGTTRGTIRFDPRKVLMDPVPPRTRIIDLTLFFEHPDWAPWCDSIGRDGLPIALRLPHAKNHLTFSFSGLSLAYPEKVRFQYKLDGRDADWSPIIREDQVTFSGLEPGEYTFLVKARNGSGVWNDEPARFAFVITPPFWATTPFRATGAAVLLLGFIGVQRLRDRRQRKARERLERIVATRTQELTEEKHRSDTLLLNILPETTAAELKKHGSAQARSYSDCTVLFSDFQGFTVLSEQYEDTGIVTELDRFFRAFDRITDKYGTEKIKTIGDAYMCASGVPEPSPTHALDAVLMALEMLSVVDSINAQRISEGDPAWPIRIGLNSGPLIAGVVGEKKFAYDVWGDTVNLASRMESNGAPGRVNVTGNVMRHVEAYVISEARGKVNIKGKGEVESWFIDRLRPEFSADERGRTANTELMDLRQRIRVR